MIDDIREKFLPRFLTSARERLARASKLVANGAIAAPSIAADLHTIAGEASIMGLHDVADMAREAELKRRAAEAEIDGFISKQIGAEAIVARVRAIIGTAGAPG